MPVAPPCLAFRNGQRLCLGLALLSFAAVTLARPPAAHADDTQRAKELFQQGTTLFNLGEFDKAIEAWQEGYKAKADPGFLYNIGQAYRLKGDATKAIFFYKGYLRNSPKAANRAEIEAKIAALQKEASEPKPAPAPATPPSVAPPPVASPPPAPLSPAPGPTPVAPPPVAAPPLAGPPAEAPPPAPMSEPEPEARPPLAPRHWVISAGLGFDSWTSGLNVAGSAPAQGGYGLAGAYSFGDVFGSSSFRLGALFHYSSIDEGTGASKNTLGFTSLAIEPSMRLRLVDRRLYLSGGLGLGVLAIGGVKKGSVVLDPKQSVGNVNGTLSTFELRAAIALELHLAPWLAVFVSPALSRGTKPKYFYEPLNRTELMFGADLFF
jgi:Tetratricopeptide repeat